jgi:hypothetical protein
MLRENKPLTSPPPAVCNAGLRENPDFCQHPHTNEAAFPSPTTAMSKKALKQNKKKQILSKTQSLKIYNSKCPGSKTEIPHNTKTRISETK